jgi:hypothetical protein
MAAPRVAGAHGVNEKKLLYLSISMPLVRRSDEARAEFERKLLLNRARGCAEAQRRASHGDNSDESGGR